MGLPHRHRSAALAAILVSSWGSPWLAAADKFITQPSQRSTSTRVEPTTASETPTPEIRQSTVASQPTVPSTSLTREAPAQANSAQANSAQANSAQANPAQATFSQTVIRQPNQARSPSAGQLASPVASTEAGLQPVSGVGQPSSPETPGQLRWLARGAVVRAPAQSETTRSAEPAVPGRTAGSTASQGPLEFNNPNFTPAASRAVVALPTPNAAQDSTGETASPAAAGPSQGAESAAEPRRVIASLVSSQIIEGRPSTHAGSRAVAPVDAPPGWQAIGEEMSRRIDSCERLLNRQACYSAREEAQVAMLYLVRMLDLMSNQYTSEPAWNAACQALEEAEDFSNTQRLTTDSEFLRRIILSHETPVLKDADATALAPLAAAQHYRQYAEHKMIEAAQGHPWAAEAIYAIGRTYQAQADSTLEATQQSLRWKAVTLYRGARAIAPHNPVAANQLGYVLLQMDRPLEAREALIAAIQIQPAAEPFQNLAEASRRLGDLSGSQWASHQAVALRGGPAPPNPPPTVVEVDPRTFAAMSPYAIGPNPQRSGHVSSVNQAAALPTATVR